MKYFREERKLPYTRILLFNLIFKGLQLSRWDNLLIITVIVFWQWKEKKQPGCKARWEVSVEARLCQNVCQVLAFWWGWWVCAWRGVLGSHTSACIQVLKMVGKGRGRDIMPGDSNSISWEHRWIFWINGICGPARWGRSPFTADRHSSLLIQNRLWQAYANVLQSKPCWTLWNWLLRKNAEDRADKVIDVQRITRPSVPNFPPAAKQTRAGYPHLQ